MVNLLALLKAYSDSLRSQSASQLWDLVSQCLVRSAKRYNVCRINSFGAKAEPSLTLLGRLLFPLKNRIKCSPGFQLLIKFQAIVDVLPARYLGLSWRVGRLGVRYLIVAIGAPSWHLLNFWKPRRESLENLGFASLIRWDAKKGLKRQPWLSVSSWPCLVESLLLLRCWSWRFTRQRIQASLPLPWPRLYSLWSWQLAPLTVLGKTLWPLLQRMQRYLWYLWVPTQRVLYSREIRWKTWESKISGTKFTLIPV